MNRRDRLPHAPLPAQPPDGHVAAVVRDGGGAVGAELVGARPVGAYRCQARTLSKTFALKNGPAILGIPTKKPTRRPSPREGARWTRTGCGTRSSKTRQPRIVQAGGEASRLLNHRQPYQREAGTSGTGSAEARSAGAGGCSTEGAIGSGRAKLSRGARILGLRFAKSGIQWEVLGVSLRRTATHSARNAVAVA
jgi:hypothetical protein